MIFFIINLKGRNYLVVLRRQEGLFAEVGRGQGAAVSPGGNLIFLVQTLR